MNDYYVKWNGLIQKRFNSPQSALEWCIKTDEKYPSKHAYECFYRDGTLQFRRHPLSAPAVGV